MFTILIKIYLLLIKINMNFIVKKNIYTNEIVDIYENMNIAAKEMGVTIQAILQAIRNHNKCKDYYWDSIDIEKEKILNLFK